MTFSAREAATRLVHGEVILWTGEMNRRDQSEEAVVCLFEGGFASKRLPLSGLDKTVSLRVPLLD
jgi:hypothetical protein